MSDDNVSINNAQADSPSKNVMDIKVQRPPKMKSMHVVSNIRNRYARTQVTSKYTNPDSHTQEATFSLMLPDTAFIAGFVMEINGHKYEAYVKEKQAAKEKYDQAVDRGFGAAHIAIDARDSNKFTVSVNVEPQTDITFILTYEELLVRKHGKYQIIVNLYPGQLIDVLNVDININETRHIINIEAPALRSGNEITNKVTKNELATINKFEDGMVHVNFRPTIEQQKEMAQILGGTNIDEEPIEENKLKGISGQFVVEYDVERDPLGGEVLVNDGYFVHFFAPTELKPIPKHIIFILDVSGSMGGRKLKQLKEAMTVILDELNTDDYFNLVKFSNDICVLNRKYTWEKIKIPSESKLPQSFEVTDKNINSVKSVVDKITDEETTNIYDALVVGLRLTSKGISHLEQTDDKHKPQPIIVFLTDGQPNKSESDPKKIIEIVERRNDCDNKTAVFTLAFGYDADKEFLKELAIQNSGFLRNIYEASDASLQLQNFYKQISSPLLTNVNFKYSEQVKEVTKHNFDILFNGSEFKVTGKVDDIVDDFVFVEALTVDGSNKFCPTAITTCPKHELKEEYGSLERLWAYMTIKQLLNIKYEKADQEKKALSEENISETGEQKNEKKIAEKEALNLALKYSFVTSITSLVVVKPDETSVEHLQEDSYDSNTAAGALRAYCLIGDNDYDEASGSICLKSSLPYDDLLLQSRNLPSFKNFPELVINKTKNLTSRIAQIFTGKSKYLQMNFNSFKVDCNVKNHIATTIEKRNYYNADYNPYVIRFTIVLPDKVVLTEFAMEFGDDVFEAEGQNKQEAKKLYKDAVSNDYSAAFVHIEKSNKINVKINIRQYTAVTFILKYQKYLEIIHGKYEVVTNLYREPTTYELGANVILNEDSLIKNVELPPLRYQTNFTKNEYTTINKINDNEVHINFVASKTQQEDIATALKVTNENISWQFIVEYEVERSTSTTEDMVTTLIALPFQYFVAVIKN